VNNIKKLFDQMDEYTLIVKKVEESSIDISATKDHKLNDESNIVHNISETAAFEIVQNNRKTTASTDMQNLEKTLENEIKNLQYIEEDSINIPEKTPVINHSYGYGDLTPMEDLEALSRKISDFIKKYPDILSYDVSASTKDIKEQVTNSYGLNISTHRKFSDIAVVVYGQGNQKANQWQYFNLPTSFENIERELKIMIEEDLPLLVNGEDLSSGQYNIIFSNDLSSDIIKNIVSMAFGNEIILDSCLKGRIGSKILSEKINIIEKATSPNYQEHFDMYGEQVQTKYIVKNGILQNYLLNRKNARRLEMNPTGHSFSFQEDFVNLYVEPTCAYDKKFTGLLIHKFLSMDINYNDAEMSASVLAFFIEDGKKVKALQNGVINLNLLNLKNIEIFDNIYKEGRVFCGSIFLRDISVNGS
jgi:predicted Zn-dependent protease